LLHNVRKLVGEQATAGLGAGLVLAGGEGDVGTGGIGEGVDGAGGFGGGAVAVDTDAAEVESEARLKEGEVGSGESLSGRTQDLMDKGGRFGVKRLSAGRGNVRLLLQGSFFLFAVRAFGLQIRGRRCER